MTKKMNKKANAMVLPFFFFFFLLGTRRSVVVFVLGGVDWGGVGLGCAMCGVYFSVRGHELVAVERDIAR